MTTDRTSGRYPRSSRLNEQLREILADEVERLTDPRIGFVTITGVEITADLRRATVYYSVLGDHAMKEESLRGLSSAASHLRRAIGEQARIKYVPVLVFVEDEAIETGMRVEQILKEIHRDGD